MRLFSGMTFIRLDGRKIVEGWVVWDTFGLLQQLGRRPGDHKEARRRQKSTRRLARCEQWRVASNGQISR